MQTALEEQVRVSKMPGIGFACSLIGIGGIGSLIALIIGLRARKIITGFEGQLSGIALAWWCIIVGALGAIILPSVFIPFLLRALR